MISDYLTLIIPGLVGGIVVAFGNIVYYKYTSDMENKRTFLKLQITDMLLPLYIHFKRVERYYEVSKDIDWLYKFLREDTKIEEIMTDKLHLAGQKLSSLLLEFLQYQYEYQLDYEISKNPDIISEKFVKNCSELRDIIYKEYEEKKEQYQKNVTGHHYFSDILNYLHSE